MSFFEVEFPRKISFGATGGPKFSTIVNQGFSGYEQRNRNWSLARAEWDLGVVARPIADFNLIYNFWLNVGGMADGFRFWDPRDNSATGAFIGTGNGVAAPVAPTLGSSAGGTLGATTYYVKTTYVSALGETTASPESSLAVGANNVLNVTSPAAATNATGYNVYVSTSTGTETKQNATPIAIGTNWTEPTSGLISGSALPAHNTSGTMVFQLQKTYTIGGRSYVYPVKKPITAAVTDYTGAAMPNTVNVYLNGALQTLTTNYTLDYTTGLVTFVEAPLNAVVITADFQFHYAVRFNTDDMKAVVEASNVANNQALVSWPGIQIIEIRL